jgi:PIN domain nuclease of toxin-antitoxin system
MEARTLTKLLLDTHVWIWALQQPHRLNAGVRRQLESTNVELYLSPVSVWEAYHLSERRRLHTKGTFHDWLGAALRRTPLREAPFSFVVAEEATRIQLEQADFGDVLLAATASILNLTLLTADDQLLAHPTIKTLRAD